MSKSQGRRFGGGAHRGAEQPSLPACALALEQEGLVIAVTSQLPRAGGLACASEGFEQPVSLTRIHVASKNYC